MHARSATVAAILTAAVLALMPVPSFIPDASAPLPHARFDEPDAAEWHARQRRVPAGGGDTAALYAQAMDRQTRMRRFASRIGRPLPAFSHYNVLDAWTSLGPGNIGGRTRVVRYHPLNHDTLFAAGVSGGLWRSDDSGQSWRLVTDGLVNIAVNALAIDPNAPDTMYAGTGEGYFREEIRGTGLPLRGGGIFITRDGGARWTRLPSTAGPDFHWVNDLELGNADPRIVYAATRTGVWRSLDGGDSWTPLLTTPVRGGCLDLALRPGDGRDVLYASCGSYEQATVYRFRRAADEAQPEIVLREPGMGRTSLAIAASNPDVVYALAASNDPGPEGRYRQGLLAVYRSDRAGDAGTWETRVRNTDPDRLNTLLLTNAGAALVENCGAPAGAGSYINMGWYINVIAVDPRDPNRVWAAGVDWFRSDDGGRTWGLVSSAGPPRTPGGDRVHVDQHGLAFHPRYDGDGNQTLIVGNDGGIYRTTMARAPALSGARATCSPSDVQVRWESLNCGYGVTQFYHGAPFPDGVRYFGGTQDNGTLLGTDATGLNGWRSLFGGDGGHVAVHPTNPQIIYVESQWANIVRSTDGGVRFQSASTGLDARRTDTLGPDANFLFVTPFVMDPSNPDRLWTGGEFLYRTTNGAQQWTKASTMLPDGGLMSAIAVAPSDANWVLAGTNKGDLLVSREALAATPQSMWAVSRPRDGWVTSVAFNPFNAQVMYVTYGNFGGAHVYRSMDGGGSWQPLDGSGDQGLPDIPVHSIVVDPDDTNRLYLGTDLGVFVSVDGGGRWLVEETGFGPAVTEWLSVIRDTSGRTRLFAFTHGRGAWRVDLR